MSENATVQLENIKRERISEKNFTCRSYPQKETLFLKRIADCDRVIAPLLKVEFYNEHGSVSILTTNRDFTFVNLPPPKQTETKNSE